MNHHLSRNLYYHLTSLFFVIIMNIISIIPARAGSKRLKNKNVKILSGKPLIYYTIRASIESNYIDRTITSTNSEKIAYIAKSYGSEIMKRSDELSRDDTPMIDVIMDIINRLEEDYIPDIIVLLQPTSPLRTSDDIDKCIDLFINNDCESVISVCECSPSSYQTFVINDEYLQSLFGLTYFRRRSQDIRKTYYPNGAVYVTTLDNLRKNNGFYEFSKNDVFYKTSLPYIMPKERSIDIDDEIDFKIAEYLYELRIFSESQFTSSTLK